MLLNIIASIILSLFQIGALLVGMYGFFNGNKKWRWFNAALVALTIVVMVTR